MARKQAKQTKRATHPNKKPAASSASRKAKPAPVKAAAAPEQNTNGGITDDQKATLYFQRKRKIIAIKEKIDSLTGDLRNEYKGLKAETGITRKDLEFGLSLLKDDDSALETHRRRMLIAQWEQHPIGTQADLFDMVNVRRADPYGEGKKMGLAGEPLRTDYAPGTADYDDLMKGFHDGQAVLARGIKAPSIADTVAEGDRHIREAAAHLGTEKPTFEVSH